MRKLLLFVLMLISMSANANKDVELSWEKAKVFVPGYFFTRSVNVELDKKYPVLIYMHGCGGPYPKEDDSWAKSINDLGIVVVAPNSFARPNRISNCDPRANRPTNKFTQAYSYRQQEIAYAKEMLKTLSWVDQDRIFLMGFSEGGVATAQNTLLFKAAIVVGWTCTHPFYASFNGVHGPENMPVLAVSYVRDPWFHGTIWQGACKDHDKANRITQVSLEGAEHDVYSNKEGRQAVLNFLKKHLE